MSSMVMANVGADYGPLVLGGMFAFGLSGSVNMQFIAYWQVYPELEPWMIKFLVIAIWLLDWCHSALVVVAVWDSVIAHYGDMSAVDDIPWSIGGAIELTAIITFLVQNFLAYRIYKLQKNKLTVAGPVFIISFFRLVAASVSMVEMIKLKRYSSLERPFPKWVFTLGMCLSALADIVITTSLFCLLRSKRSLIESTNRVVDTLAVWTVENGSATCFGSVATLICWLAFPSNRTFVGLHFVVAKLYANSLLATLNARIKIHKIWRQATSPDQLQPITILPDSVFVEGDEESAAASPTSQRGHFTNHFALKPSDKKHPESGMKMIIVQPVKTKYDRESSVNVIPEVSELGHEEGDPHHARDIDHAFFHE